MSVADSDPGSASSVSRRTRKKSLPKAVSEHRWWLSHRGSDLVVLWREQGSRGGRRDVWTFGRPEGEESGSSRSRRFAHDHLGHEPWSARIRRVAGHARIADVERSESVRRANDDLEKSISGLEAQSFGVGRCSQRLARHVRRHPAARARPAGFVPRAAADLCRRCSVLLELA
jgi:hypothetical protein